MHFNPTEKGGYNLITGVSRGGDLIVIMPEQQLINITNTDVRVQRILPFLHVTGQFIFFYAKTFRQWTKNSVMYCFYKDFFIYIYKQVKWNTDIRLNSIIRRTDDYAYTYKHVQSYFFSLFSHLLCLRILISLYLFLYAIALAF